MPPSRRVSLHSLATSMPGFLQRFRHPLRHLRSQSRTNPHSSSGASHDHSDEAHDNRKSPSAMLPEILDRGPYHPSKYTSEDLYWNSVLIETDHGAKAWRRSRPCRTRPITEQTDTSGTINNGTRKYVHVHGRFFSSKRGRNNDHVTPFTSAGREKSDSHGHQRFEHNNSHGEMRADNDLTAKSYFGPINWNRLDVVQSQRSPEPLSPGTTEWDAFLDLPPSETTHVNDEYEQFHTVAEPDFPRSAPLFCNQEERYPPALPLKERNPFTLSQQDSYRETDLTYQSSLVRNISVEDIHPPRTQAVYGGVNDCKTTNGNGEGEHFFPPSQAASLVPNLRHPVIEKGFHDCRATEQSYTSVLANGTDYDTSFINEDGPISLTVDYSPSLRLAHVASPLLSSNASAFRHGIPSSQHSSVSTSSTSSDSLHHQLPPRDSAPIDGRPNPAPFASPARIHSLLRTVLSPSEFSLFTTTRTQTPPPLGVHPPLSPSRSNFHFHYPRPLQTRLTSKCYTLIHHLQDRISYMEDNLIPTMGEALEHMTYTIDFLSLEVQRLGDQIKEMKVTVEYGNCVLAGCWMREFELWRTLAGIRGSRRARGTAGLFRRLMGHSKSKGIEDGVLSPANSPRMQALSKRELDAVILVAEQNVQILREDVDEMTDRVEGMKRKYAWFPVVEGEEGSWRDV